MVGVFTPNKWANVIIRALFIPREPIFRHLLVHCWVSLRCTFYTGPQSSPVGFGSSYPHILGTFMYLSRLLALPPGASWGHLQNKSMSQSQLLGQNYVKLRHDWTLLCTFIKPSPWPLDYCCISKASTSPFSKEVAGALRFFSKKPFLTTLSRIAYYSCHYWSCFVFLHGTYQHLA